MTQIVRCKVENILGAKDVEFAPNGKGVTIGGANGQGKSSAIWALCMALGGKGQIPAKPVHDGVEKGSVVVELDKFTVTMEVKANRSSTLTVQSKDGAQYRSPQTMLNELFGGLSFDPGEFMRFDQAKRFRTLVELLKVDPSALEEKERTLREQRRDVGREVKTLEGKISGRSFHKDAPTEEINVSDLLAEIEKVQSINRGHNEKLAEAANLDVESATLARDNKQKLDEIAQLEALIKQKRQEIEANEKRREANWNRAESLRATVEQEKAERNTSAEAEALHEQIRNADVTNRKVRENIETLAIKDDLEVARSRYADLTSQIEGCEKEKEQLLASASLPIEGLSLANSTILFNGVPLEQASESEQWEVATAIGFALNPQGIVFMRNCGGLDRRSRERVRDRAAALGVQLFMEIVDDCDDVQILIEEGQVKENRLEATAT